MFSYLLLITSLLFAPVAFSEDLITEDIFGSDGSVWTDRDQWNTKDCLDDFDPANCPAKGETKPFVCMQYSNDSVVPIVCRLTVSALLAEPFTDFIKVVTDIRYEVVFFNQRHNVCFNFAKDEYNAWILLEISDPIIECFAWGEK